MRQTLEEVAILVTADVTGLYPSIPYSEGLEVLRKQYDKFMYYKVHAEDIIEMADFVLKNKYLELLQAINSPSIYLYFSVLNWGRISQDAIYKTMGVEMIHWLCILYLEGQWRKLGKSLKDLNGFHPKIKFTYKKSKEKVNFLEVAVKIKNGRLNTDLYSKLVNNHQQHYYSLLSASWQIYYLQRNFEVKENFIRKKRSQVPCTGCWRWVS